MSVGLFLFGILAIGVSAALAMVLRKLGLDQKEAFAIFLLASAAAVASTAILFLTAL